jgi:bisphosphoglycerate-independent phosphoglycerate mutase (AlkP superfamily)
MDKPLIKDAIAKGKLLIKEGKSKADAAMAIFEALKAEEKDVVIAAFIDGATLTPAGAVTYFYNCKRKAKKAAKSA